MSKTPAIPEGYRPNANGDLVKIENIRQIDLLRDELVMRVAERAQEKAAALATFRDQVFEEIEAFLSESAKRFKAKMGGAKGNLTLLSFDGRFKVLVANRDKITFDERLQIAKSLIDKCIKSWSGGADEKLMVLVNNAFQVDKDGNVSVRRILELRQYDIDDPAWKKAMDAISESIRVIGSKRYVRVYERDAYGDYRPISLDVASA